MNQAVSPELVDTGDRSDVLRHFEENPDVDGADKHVPDSEVRIETLPGGPAACTTHVGPYDSLPEAWAAVQKWIEEQWLTPAGAPWEDYVTDPADVPDPRDWKTDIFWPVR